MDQGYADAQAAQQCDVQKKVAEVFTFDNGPINRDHEHFVAKTRHVAKDLS